MGKQAKHKVQREPEQRPERKKWVYHPQVLKQAIVSAGLHKAKLG